METVVEPDVEPDMETDVEPDVHPEGEPEVEPDEEPDGEPELEPGEEPDVEPEAEYVEVETEERAEETGEDKDPDTELKVRDPVPDIGEEEQGMDIEVLPQPAVQTVGEDAEIEPGVAVPREEMKPEPMPRRSGRATKPPKRYDDFVMQHRVNTQKSPNVRTSVSHNVHTPIPAPRVKKDGTKKLSKNKLIEEVLNIGKDQSRLQNVLLNMITED
jgi:hypothetical protein